MWQSNCSLNLITACATFSSRNYRQVLVVTGNEPLISLWRNVGPLFSAEFGFFSHIWRFLSMNGRFKVGLKHFNWLYNILVGMVFLSIKCCVFYARLMGSNPSKKFRFCLVISPKIFPEVLVMIEMLFVKYKTNLGLLLGLWTLLFV